MPHYHFHLIEDGDVLHDGDGREIASDADAQTRAARDVWALLAEELRETGVIRMDRAIMISREDSEHLHVLPFEAAVRKSDHASSLRK